MLKIYNAIGTTGKLVLKKGIELEHGRFNTEKNGFGTIVTGRDCKKADYLGQDLEDFKRYIAEIEKSNQHIRNNPYLIKDFYSKEEIRKYERLGTFINELNEEAILLFTNQVIMSYYRGMYIEKIMGRFKDSGAYILLPGAIFNIAPSRNNTELDDDGNYEVLESTSRPKQLYLIKTDRQITAGRIEINI